MAKVQIISRRGPNFMRFLPLQKHRPVSRNKPHRSSSEWPFSPPVSHACNTQTETRAGASHFDLLY